MKRSVRASLGLTVVAVGVLGLGVGCSSNDTTTVPGEGEGQGGGGAATTEPADASTPDTSTGTAPVAAAQCGNGILEGDEVCDGKALGGQTCATAGFKGGTLSCASCALDTTRCHMDAAPVLDSVSVSKTMSRDSQGRVTGVLVEFKIVAHDPDSGNFSVFGLGDKGMSSGLPTPTAKDFPSSAVDCKSKASWAGKATCSLFAWQIVCSSSSEVTIVAGSYDVHLKDDHSNVVKTVDVGGVSSSLSCN